MSASVTDFDTQTFLTDLATEKVGRRFAGGFERIAREMPHLDTQRRQCEEWARTFSRETDKGLYLSGKTGSSKTALAAAIVIDLVSRGFGVEFSNVADLLADVRASYDSDDVATEHEIVEEAAGVDLLVLDDLGAEKITEHSIGILERIIDRRYRALKPIVITSNLDGDALYSEMGDFLNGQRLVSRLCEMVEGVALPARDMRVKKQTTKKEDHAGPRT